MAKKITKKLQHFFAGRTRLLLIVFAVMGGVIIARLFQLQVVRGSQYANSFSIRTTATRTLKSTRGRIYDVNGKLLAYNELASTITIEDNGSYDTTRDKNLRLNGEIYRLTSMIRKNGDALQQDFHINVDAHGNYAFDTRNDTTLARFRADIFGYQTVDELKDDEASADADSIMHTLMASDRFGLEDEDQPYTEQEKKNAGLPTELTKQEALDIVVVRYQLSLVSYQRYMAVTVAANVSEETVADVEENLDSLQGVSVSEDYIRKYNNAESMAPIIGYTGKPSADELAELQKTSDKYNSNSIIGKAGIEQSMETSLQGTDGSEEVTIDNVGKVISENEKSRQAPVQGNDVYLTIDSDLQNAVYQILEQRIAGIVMTYLTDAKTIDREHLGDNDTMPIASYDCYNAVIGNNMVDMNAFADDNASADEKALYSKLQSREKEILGWINSELSGKGTAYSSLTDEQKAYIDYIINDFLTDEYGILNESQMDTEDSNYQQFFTDQSISAGDFLRYACNNNWIDVTQIQDETETYLTSEEIFQAVLNFIQNHAGDEEAFQKLLYKYMLLDDVITPQQVMLTLYEQGVLDKNDGDYSGLKDGSLSAYSVLMDKINNLEITPAMLALDPCSGSVVITDPDTGQVRACVTYPGYDNNRLSNTMDSDYFTKLNTDLSTPFYNKATQQLTAPGSTYKMVMAAAGMNEGVINADTSILCTGIFGEDLDFLSDADRVHCWNEYGHGYLNVVGALQNSCNVFFCTVGFDLGLVGADQEYDQAVALQKEQKYAAMFGLNQETGIEIPESEPHVSDQMPIPSSIGQGTHQYTTTQLARYVSTIANKGACYDLTLISRITDPNGKTLQASQPKETSDNTFNSTIWDNIDAGMGAAVDSDTAWSGFSSDIYVYGKTGTAQESMLRPDHALCVGFTETQNTDNVKYDDVAFAVRIAEGYSSRNASLVARDALEYYFNLKDESEVLTGASNANDMTEQIVAD